MKKSEVYHLAQIATITSSCLAPEVKLEVLKVLIEAENLALFCEDKEEVSEK